MRLVDADAIEKQAYDDVHYHAELEDWEFDVVTHYLDHAPTIDAVQVCRCWDCERGLRCVDGYVRCSHPSGKIILMKGSDFCSYGERKEADGNG